MSALADQHAELAGLLADLGDDGWSSASRCDGWSVADVVLHLAQTDEMAVASLRGAFGEVLSEMTSGLGPTADVDEGAAMMVERERGRPTTEIGRRWQASAEQLVRSLETVDARQRVVWVAGELSARTLATTRLAECWIHTGDVAEALEVSMPASDRLRHVAYLAWRTLPYAFARAGRELGGPVAFELRGPDGTTWDYVPESEPRTTIRGDAVELCLVAARRAEPAETSLVGAGPDAEAVLELVRTYA